MKNSLHRTFMETIALALVNIRQRENLGRLNSKLEQLYIQDQMTGLYNRFGYMNLAKAYMQKYDGDVYLLYMDMDNLIDEVHDDIDAEYEEAMEFIDYNTIRALPYTSSVGVRPIVIYNDFFQQE